MFLDNKKIKKTTEQSGPVTLAIKKRGLGN